ncbi:MAG: glycoside hydrolase family 13 protein [Ignavibacterium sp.]|nr:glycoside hydrolase family 13 protein [Ignavibacterium sp.]MDW8375082.1 glycoside hydrolase family 13 protein [Ignavibacteriales bacterium]
MKLFESISLKFLFLIISLFVDTLSQQDSQSLYEKVITPEWSKRVVWYQIFPERFYNGDTTNDPTLNSLEGSYPHDTKSEWQIHPWTSDWYELQPYEKKNGKNIWFNIQRRRYGGDIQGIIDKLDYLKDLGIGAIYLNPVFEAPSSHKYDGATYHHIDPHFGPNPDLDKKLIQSEIPDDPSTWVWTSADKLFLKLIKEVHHRGMKIIIDGVFNHMGLNSWAFRDVIKNQQKSKFKDWFNIKSWKSDGNFDYEGWFGVRELPEFKEDDNGIVEGPKEYIFNITKRWMDPNGDGNPEDGIDGWRLDVAFCVKHQFWKDWRKLVKSINPEAFLTAEIVDTPEANIDYLKGDEFDAVMNYNFLFSTAEYFIDDKTKIPASKFIEDLNYLRGLYPEQISYSMQNLFGSHDTQRVLSHIKNRDKYKIRNWGQTFEKWKAINPEYDFSKPGKYEKDIFKLMLIFQMTYVGAPYVYYGDEVGMWGANDPCCRKPMIWKEFNYQNESFTPNQIRREEEDIVEPDFEIFNHYKKLISIRNNNEALQIGKFQTILVDDKRDLIIFKRYDDKNEIIIFINRSSENQVVEINVEHNEIYIDLLNEEKIIQTENRRLSMSVEPLWGAILLKSYYK